MREEADSSYNTCRGNGIDALLDSSGAAILKNKINATAMGDLVSFGCPN
jgi:hypothetical protein